MQQFQLMLMFNITETIGASTAGAVDSLDCSSVSRFVRPLGSLVLSYFTISDSFRLVGRLYYKI